MLRIFDAVAATDVASEGVSSQYEPFEATVLAELLEGLHEEVLRGFSADRAN